MKFALVDSNGKVISLAASRESIRLHDGIDGKKVLNASNLDEPKKHRFNFDLSVWEPAPSNPELLKAQLKQERSRRMGATDWCEGGYKKGRLSAEKYALSEAYRTAVYLLPKNYDYTQNVPFNDIEWPVCPV